MLLHLLRAVLVVVFLTSLCTLPGAPAAAQPTLEGCCRCLGCPNGDFCRFVGDSGTTCMEVCAGCDAIDPNDLCSPECFAAAAPAAGGVGLAACTALLLGIGVAALVRRRSRPAA